MLLNTLQCPVQPHPESEPAKALHRLPPRGAHSTGDSWMEPTGFPCLIWRQKKKIRRQHLDLTD